MANSPEGAAMCLAYDSLIIADRVGKVPRRIIKRYRNGQAPESVMAQIAELLKKKRKDETDGGSA
ncbi:MAG: hypothetical protein MUC87_15560 [Bacteroidia bacterium]|nr:hypothetical protein [Bacteroidia bacterium]